MESSIFSFIMALIWNSVFIVLLYIGRKNKFFIKSFGVSSIVALYIFSAVRLLLPFEFSFTKIVESYKIYPAFIETFTQTVATESGSVRIWHILLAVWVAVTIFLISKILLQHSYAMKRFRLLAPVEDLETQAIFKRIQGKHDKPVDAAIVKCKAVQGAMSVGIIHKYILLPDRTLSSDELYCTLSHEYTHLKNRDQLVKLFSILYCNLFWWNPLSYLLLRDLEQSLELKCDHNVLKEWSVKEKCSYMEVVAQDIRHKKNLQRVAGAVYLTGTSVDKQLKERFRMIITSPKPTSKSLIALSLTVCISIFVFSYAFVIQSAYEAPMDEIEATPNTYYIDKKDIYLQLNANGEYELVCPYGKQVISEQTAQIYIEDGHYFLS